MFHLKLVSRNFSLLQKRHQNTFETCRVELMHITARCTTKPNNDPRLSPWQRLKKHFGFRYISCRQLRREERNRRMMKALNDVIGDLDNIVESVADVRVDENATFPPSE